ncbi:MAG: ABC transporter ATP-binding protein [Gammaproteobacteria bacterium]|nr:ABC transporter ATP-binding protein [Gammaproteobacteria bacterium]
MIEARELTVEIADQTVVNNLNLTLHRGECWAVMGRNGVGKTTLIATLAGLRPAAAGTVSLNSTPLAKLSRREVAREIGLLFQEESHLFPSTVHATALGGRFPHLSPWQIEGREDLQLVDAALQRVELDHLRQRSVATLSGGEKRRLDLAVLLVQDPPFLLLDEPVNHLDLRYQVERLHYIHHLTRRGEKGVLMALHDINLAHRFCDHVLLLYGDGEFEAGVWSDLINGDRLQRLYGYPVRPVEDGSDCYWLPV